MPCCNFYETRFFSFTFFMDWLDFMLVIIKPFALFQSRIVLFTKHPCHFTFFVLWKLIYFAKCRYKCIASVTPSPFLFRYLALLLCLIPDLVQDHKGFFQLLDTKSLSLRHFYTILIQSCGCTSQSKLPLIQEWSKFMYRCWKWSYFISKRNYNLTPGSKSLLMTIGATFTNSCPYFVSKCASDIRFFQCSSFTIPRI